MRIRPILFFVSALICGSAAFADDTVEVLHRWTSPGEAAAVSALKRELSVQGLAWVDMSIPGGDPAGTMTELRKRVMTKDPPTAAVMFFTDAREWARLGALANLNDVAERDGWDRMIPKSMQAASKYEDKWVSVPININLYNSLWASRAVLQSAGIAEMPVTWNQFIDALEKLKKKGLIGLAASRQPWELAIIFESVVVATGGADFHRKAFVQRDRAALGSDTMKKVFDRMAQLRGYTDADYTKRDWPASAALVANDKAGFQIMGDWAKGEFTQAGKVAGRDFLCGRTPGTQGTTIYASDQFAMFNLSSGGFRRQNTQQAQARLASAILSAKGQIAFNTAKGSNPVRVDLPEGPFDVCTRGAMQNLQEADKKGGMVVPMVRIVSTATRQAILEIIERQFSGKMTSAEAVTTMAAVVE